MYTHSYLKKKGIKIYKDDKQILVSDDEYDYPQQETKIVLGEHLIDEEEYEKEASIDYNQLKQFNICIASKRIPFTVSKNHLYLAYNEAHPNEYGFIPKEHKLIFNSYTREVQLKGNKVLKGKTKWLKIDRTKNFKGEKSDEQYIKEANKSTESLFPEGTFKKKKKFKVIPEIAVGFSSYGELVCMEKSRDAPRIGLAGETGRGKGLPLDSPIFTPSGIKKNGDLKRGDLVCTPNGNYASVIGVFPQGKQEMYQLNFKDGISLKCDKNHLWQVNNNDIKRYHSSKIINTEEMFKHYQKIKYHKRPQKFWIDVPTPVNFNHKDIPIPPYLLGFLIGDGCLTKKSNVLFSTHDIEILERIRQGLEKGYRIVYADRCSFRISKVKRNHNLKNRYYESILKLKLNVHSYKKFIPSKYIFNSKEIRLEFLKGYMDADGYTQDGMLRFCTTSKRLSQDLKLLIESLGGVVYIRKSQKYFTYNGIKKKGRECYIGSVSIKNQKSLFSLQRKKDVTKERIKYKPKRYLDSIEKLSKEEETLCIKVDTPPHLYLTTNCIITHNTWFLHRFKDQCIEKEYARVIELNDKKEETGDYSFEWEENSKFREELKRINEISKPLPMVYLYPVNDVLENKPLLEKELSFKISLSYKELVQNLKVFSGFYDLGKSGDYFDSVLRDKEGDLIKKGGLLSCKTLSEIKDYIDDHTITKENKKMGLQDLMIPHSSNPKLKAFFTKIKKANILDIFNKVNTKWGMEFLDGNRFRTYPWTACLISGLSCSIESIHIRDEPYYYVELYYLLKNIFEEKKTNPRLKDETLIIFGDEIPDLMKDPNSFDLIYDIARSGRSGGIGVFLATQFYKEIHPSIRTNLSHFLIFQQKVNDPQMKEDLFKHHPELYKKTFLLGDKECIACGDYILYNPITGERYSNNGVPIKMKLLPPNSKHHPPPSKKVS